MASPVDSMKAQGNGGAVTTRGDILSLLQHPKTMKGLTSIAGKILDPERLVKLAIFSVNKTPLLQSCTPQSVLGSLMLSASFGLEPNTPSQQAFLIPYKKRRKVEGRWIDTYECQFQFGYRGMITLAYRSKIVKRIKAEGIRAADFFEYQEGSDSFLKYRKSLTRRGDLVGAFCFTELETGEHAATVLPAEHIEKVRGKSETYNFLLHSLESAESAKDREKAEKKFQETPWVQWDDQMWSKTAIKAHCGQLPIFDVGHNILSAAAEVDNAADAGLIDMADFAEPDAAHAAREGMLEHGGEEDEDGASAAKQVAQDRIVTTSATAERQPDRAIVEKSDERDPDLPRKDTVAPADRKPDSAQRDRDRTTDSQSDRPASRSAGKEGPGDTSGPEDDRPRTTRGRPVNDVPEEPAGLFGSGE